MYPMVNYEMTETALKKILGASQPVPVLMVGGFSPSPPQENANMAWEALGKEMGFDYTTVRPINGKGGRFFSARPSETEEVKKERAEKEEAEMWRSKIEELKTEISGRHKRIEVLIVKVRAYNENIKDTHKVRKD